MFKFSSNEKTVIVLIFSSLLIGSIVRSYKVNKDYNFCSYANIAPTQTPRTELININSAEENDLIALKGIGPALARDIIRYREKFGFFRSKKDLMKVKGIGNKRFEDIKNDITVE